MFVQFFYRTFHIYLSTHVLIEKRRISMKKINIIIIAFLLTCSTYNITSSSQIENTNYHQINQAVPHIPANSLSVHLSIESPIIRDSGDKPEILIDGFGSLRTPGLPALPIKIFSVAIPPNARPIGFSYSLDQTTHLHDHIHLIPNSVPSVSDTTVITPDFSEVYEQNIKNVYQTNAVFPDQIITFEQRSGLKSFNLLDFKVIPFSFVPKTGELSFHSDITITIEYQLPSETDNTVIPVSVNTFQQANQIIVNYDQAKSWYGQPTSLDQGLYDYVIITLNSLIEAIQPLVSWEQEKGRTVNVVTLDQIEDEYTGYDTVEKIRNFLREKYPIEQWGIKDLCIIGHWDDIPMRETSQKLGFDGECAETDFYYAELSFPDDESWDSDGDHRYGENSDDIDFYGEITVGRIPWSDFETVRHICEKSVAYEQNSDPSFRNNILLLSNFVDDNTDGATFMEYCVNEELHPFMSSWMKTRMYERDSTFPFDYVLNHLNVRNVWSKGMFGVVSWHSHGNPFGSGGFISVDDCQYLNDDYPAIISAASCSNSDTDYLNIGQAMMKQGAVGFLGANKAAPYQSQWDDVSDGSDQSLKYLFLSSLNSGEMTQGQAHQYALSEMYKRDLWDFLKYETFVHGSLFGNPDLGISSPFQDISPLKPEIPVGPNSGKVNQEQSYSTSAIDPDDDNLYYCFSWGDGSVDWFGPYVSGELVSVSHSWSEEGEFEIKVKAKDVTGSESDWSDPLVVSMPKSSAIFTLFLNFLENHPNMFPLLRQLLKL